MEHNNPDSFYQVELLLPGSARRDYWKALFSIEKVQEEALKNSGKFSLEKLDEAFDNMVAKLL